MRPATLLSALTFATFSAAAVIDSQGSAAIVARGHEIEARGDSSLPLNQHFEKRHLTPRWEDGSETFGWPADSVGRGTVDYQFVVTNLGNNKFRVQLYHSGPANGRDVRYTFTAPGISIVKTLKPRSSTSFEVAKSGDGFQVKIERP
ncbi:uncharacterized protein NECHADRAFT_105993 [Fusarium vanettenii 77-13-4]|uniref:Uncharacterized protein n=1 Tax=Fusarium vanettenii (strain ATCC MYA-4622 / CBS 123669 / FGSC 9596 / NRRL 45880 / 77-13-4) TaxID=660122 RepID=C7YMW1_FUSV7|nr:uncharacterized protein NECHADRAFT_105993 [Fusarium vanettenii 77-13-4]EEU47018.1 predicted protein [Fusarium vanettenii 77-13-4]